MEQIYNNASERSKVIYVGTLAGLIPAGPGHSHQGVRDIATMGSVPGMIVLEPANESQVAEALDWAVTENETSTYIRLCSFPVDTDGFEYGLPNFGTGNICKEGTAATIIASGPLMLRNAIDASRLLANEGVDVSVIDIPWVTNICTDWLQEAIAETPHLIVLDNHFEHGGLMDRLNSVLVKMATRPNKISHLAVKDIPVCGTPDEVLAYHGLAVESIITCMH